MTRASALKGLRLGVVLVLGMVSSGCALTGFPGAAQTLGQVADPSLETDPARPPESDTDTTVAPWQWHDGAQRWRSTGSKPPPRLTQDAWVMEPAAISLRVVASPQLNWFDQRPHSVVLKLVQASDGLDFERNRAAPFVLQGMLAGTLDNSKFLDVRTFSIDPGSDTVINLDRLDLARYVGIVVGFYQLDGRESARLVPVPPILEMSDESIWLNRLTLGWLGAGDAVVRPARLKIVLRLGQFGIDDMRVLSR